MRTKAERRLATALRIQPNLLMLATTDNWSQEDIYELIEKDYIILDRRRATIPVMILTEKAKKQLSTEEVTYEKTHTYLSADWSSGVTRGGGGTGKPDCDTCGSPEYQRDETEPPTGGGSR